MQRRTPERDIEKCEWKLCIMPAKKKLLRNLFCVFFSVFSFLLPKWNCFQILPHCVMFFFFGFILFTCVRHSTACTGIEFEIVLLLLLLLPLQLRLPLPLPVVTLRSRRSHSDTVYGFDMALFMQLPQLFVQLQIDFLNLCSIYSSLMPLCTVWVKKSLSSARLLCRVTQD